MPLIKKKKNHLLEGDVFKSILIISIPIIFANILQTVYQLIDTFWVGRLGAEAVAAISLSFPILFFLTSLSMGFTMAGSILVAQYNGKGDKRRVSLATGQTFSIVISIAIIVSIIGYFLANPLFNILTEDPFVLSQGVSYLQISFLSMPALFIYAIFQSALRGVGEVKLPMILIFITVVINFFIDPLFMYGWKFIPAMGVKGVAWATLLTEYLSALIAVAIILRGKYGFDISLSDLRFKKKWVLKIFKLGLPSSLEMSSRSLGMFLMMIVVSSFGTVVVAAYGIGIKILSFVIIPAMGFSISTSTLVGNNLGAKQYLRTEEIVKTGMKIGFWTLTILAVIIFISAQNIASFFIPNEFAVIAETTTFIRMISLTFGSIGIQMVIIGTLKAAGQTTTSMFLAIIYTVSLFILSYLFAYLLSFGSLGIWITYPVANIFALLFALYFYKQKKWLSNNLT